MYRTKNLGKYTNTDHYNANKYKFNNITLSDEIKFQNFLMIFILAKCKTKEIMFV